MISDLHGLDTLKYLLDEKNEHFFTPSLCNFLCSLKQNTELWSAVNKKALAEKNEANASLNTKETQLLKTLENNHKKVEQYCDEHNIEIPIGFMGVEGINEFRAYKQGKIVSSWYIIDSLIQAHINALSNLVNTNLKFVKQFASVNENGAVVVLKISPLIDEWNVAKQALVRKQTSKFWYAWQQLTKFHKIYHDFEHLRIDALKSGQLLQEWQLCEDLKKINNLNNSKGDLYKKELRFCLQQLLQTLTHILSSKNNSSNNTTEDLAKERHINKTSRLKLKRKESIIIIDGEKHSIKSNLQLRYIGLFFKQDGSPKAKKIFDDVIHSKVFHSDANDRNSEFTKTEKDQVAGLKKHFNDIIQVKNREHSIKTEYLN